MNIAIIPARGGSKRIPRKNIKLFHGKPIIAYAIELARNSGIFDHVIVSTDDNEVAEIAECFGATVPWLRSNELSDDYSSTLSVIRDAVLRLESDKLNFENVCCIYPTTPLLSDKYIKKALILLSEGGWDYVISASKSRMPPERFFKQGMSSEIKMSFPEFADFRTQDIKESYFDAGQFYWGMKKSWASGKPILTSVSAFVELPYWEITDIDEGDDWVLAELLHTARFKTNE